MRDDSRMWDGRDEGRMRSGWDREPGPPAPPGRYGPPGPPIGGAPPPGGPPGRPRESGWDREREPPRGWDRGDWGDRGDRGTGTGTGTGTGGGNSRSTGSSDVATRNLFVANIPPETSEGEVQAHFSKYGAVLGVKFLPKKLDTIAAFVDFQNLEDARDAH